MNGVHFPIRRNIVKTFEISTSGQVPFQLRKLPAHLFCGFERPSPSELGFGPLLMTTSWYVHDLFYPWGWLQAGLEVTGWKITNNVMVLVEEEWTWTRDKAGLPRCEGVSPASHACCLPCRARWGQPVVPLVSVQTWHQHPLGCPVGCRMSVPIHLLI